MAFYVKIRKLAEADTSVEYDYSADDVNFGRLEIDKATGDVSSTCPAPGDDNEHLFMRAAAKLRSEFRAGKFPDVTEWAS